VVGFVGCMALGNSNGRTCTIDLACRQVTAPWLDANRGPLAGEGRGGGVRLEVWGTRGGRSEKPRRQAGVGGGAGARTSVEKPGTQRAKIPTKNSEISELLRHKCLRVLNGTINENQPSITHVLKITSATTAEQELYWVRMTTNHKAIERRRQIKQKRLNAIPGSPTVPMGKSRPPREPFFSRSLMPGPGTQHAAKKTADGKKPSGKVNTQIQGKPEPP